MANVREGFIIVNQRCNEVVDYEHLDLPDVMEESNLTELWW
ncbi:MAG TPA: hypothetical protein VIH27_07150 [Nitrososphaerales archaeon]